MDIAYQRSPSESFAPELLTWRDILQRLMDSGGVRASGTDDRKLRSATLDAYRDLCNRRDWKFLMGEWVLSIPPLVTAEGYYDHTGGSSERLVTITDGTSLPSNINQYTAIIDSACYEIDESISSSSFTLTLKNNPGEDKETLADPGTIKIVRGTFAAPADFVKAYDPQPERGYATLEYVSYDEYKAMQTAQAVTGQARFWTLAAHPKYYGSRAIMIYPFQSSRRAVRIPYRRTARNLNVSGFASTHAGTFTLDINTDANRATLVGTTVTESLVGSVIRVRSDTNTPENRDGATPFEQQFTIIDVNTVSNYVYLDRDSAVSYTAKAYVISDPVDLPQYAINAFIAGAKYYYAINSEKEQRDISLKKALYDNEILLCMEQDPGYIPSPQYSMSMPDFQDDE